MDPSKHVVFTVWDPQRLPLEVARGLFSFALPSRRLLLLTNRLFLCNASGFGWPRGGARRGPRTTFFMSFSHVGARRSQCRLKDAQIEPRATTIESRDLQNDSKIDPEGTKIPEGAIAQLRHGGGFAQQLDNKISMFNGKCRKTRKYITSL